MLVFANDAYALMLERQAINNIFVLHPAKCDRILRLIVGMQKIRTGAICTDLLA
jgi:hypothetical protein